MLRSISRHAAARLQQRAIPLPVLQCLLDYGEAVHDHRGAEVLYFDKAARQRLSLGLVDGAAAFLRRFQRYMNSYAVVGSDGVLVTVGRRRRRLRRDA